VVEAGLLSRSVFLVMDSQWVELLIRRLVEGFCFRFRYSFVFAIQEKDLGVLDIGAPFLAGAWRPKGRAR